MKKRILSLILAALMVLSLLPVSALADDDEPEGGACGDQLTWLLDEDAGLLTISGTGAMWDYDSPNSNDHAPWFEKNCTALVVEDGVTSIGAYAFYRCDVRSADLGSVTAVGDYAFYGNGSLEGVDLSGLTTVGNSAFASCISLTGPGDVLDLNNVTSIGDCAFAGCTLLTEVYLKNVTSIGNGAFSSCSNLSDIYYMWTSADWANVTKGANWNSGCPAGQKVRCADGDIDAFGGGTPGGGDDPGVGQMVRVTLYANDGSEAYTVLTSTNGSITLPDTPPFTNGDLVLCGWAESADSTQANYLAGDEIKATLNLYAVWATVSGDYMYTLDTNNNAVIVGYSGSADPVLIPSSLDEYDVVRIAAGSGIEHAGLDMIVFGNTVGTWFAYNTELMSVEILGDTRGIEEFAFYGCSNLSTIYYEGTSAEWAGLPKGNYWNTGCAEDLQVICLGDPLPTTYTVTASASPAEGGTVTGAGTYEAGDPVTLTVVPSAGYAFESLSVDGTDVTSGVAANTYTFDMPDHDVTVTATFSALSDWQQLQNLFAAGGSITLDRDCTDAGNEGPLVVPTGKTVTLDLGGHTIDRGLSGGSMQSNGYVIYVSSGATLSISNGTVTGGRNSGAGGGIYVAARGALDLSGVAVQGNRSTEHGGGIYLAGSARCTAENSSVTDNQTTVNANGSGGGIYLTSGQLMLTNCSVSDNRAKNLGGGIYIESGHAELIGCDIDRNDAYANACGGGAFLSGGSLLLNGCEVIGNTSSKSNPHGIGVFVNVGARFVVSGETTITDNKSGTQQLNVFLHNGAVINTVNLAETASIGVAVGKTNSSYIAEYRAGTITSGLTDGGSAASFTSDLDAYEVILDTNGEAALVSLCSVTVDPDIQHGTVTADKDPAEYIEGSTVTLTVQADAGYVLSGLTVKNGSADVEYAEGENNTYTFPMPANDVTVTATFRRDVNYGMDVYLDEEPGWGTEPVFPYTGGPVTPTVRITDSIDGVELTEGTDYTVSYPGDNTGSEEGPAEVTVTITGIGDYAGTKTVTFRITPYDLADCEIKGTLEAYFDGYQVVPAAGVEVWYGETLLERDTDYYIEVEWAEEYVVGEPYAATVYGMGDYLGEQSFEVTYVELHHPVVFDANGGTGTMAGKFTTTHYQYGEIIDLPDCGFTAPYGMAFSYWEVSWEEYGEPCVSDPLYPNDTFDAPNIWQDTDVTTITVKAVWEARSEDEMVTLTTSGMEHGSLLLNGEAAELTDGALSLFENGRITVLPKSGYAINTVSYNDGSDHDVDPDDEGNYSFTMPACDATLTATFDYLLATEPTIVTQPADLVLTYGYNEGALTVEAAGLEGQPLTYQWYSCDDAAGTNPQAIDGATDASFTVPEGKDADTLEYYFCVVTATREDNGLSAETTTDVSTVTVEKADYYGPDELSDLTQYVPGDKAGEFTLALPPLPEGAAYSCMLADEGGLLDTAPEISGETALTFTAVGGKDAGTTAVITVTASGAFNYNDYSFDVSVVVSEYTAAYAWPEQTSIWLDADNELVWSEDGVILDTSLITVTEDEAAVDLSLTAAVGDTVLQAGENPVELEPGAYRITITGEGLYDWVDFTVIELIEDDPDFILDIPDWTYPDVAEDSPEELQLGWAEIVGSLTYDGNTIEMSRDDIANGDGIDDGSLRLWYENADSPRYSDTVFLTRELTIDDFCNVDGARERITPFGDVAWVGDRLMYLPHYVTVKQLLDEDGEPVTAGNGGSIYYMCSSRPDLHAEQADNGAWVLYNGDAPVPEGYYYRDGEDFYYGNGENAYATCGGEADIISFWPVKSYAQGTVYPMGDKPVTQSYNFDENGDRVYVDDTLACGDYTKPLESHYDARPSYDETVYVGKNYFYYKSFLYTGNITPTVSGSTISFGDYQVDMGELAIAWLPDDEIDGSGATDVWSFPHAYARYKVDDYHYQIADQEFIIYPSNSLITIKNLKDEYHVGEDAEFVIELLQLERGMSVFVNGELYGRFEGHGDQTLTLENLQEGNYEIRCFGDGDEYVTGYSTSTSFTVVPNTLTITAEPEDASAPLGEVVSTTVAAEGEGLQYQWYYRDPGKTDFRVSSIKMESYSLTLTTARIGREVYCVVTDAEGHSVTTRTATLNVVLPEDYVSPAITQDAADCFVGPGEMPSVPVAATGYGELKYQWYYRNAGAEAWNVSSIKTDTYACAMKLSRHGRQIYCVVSDAYGNTAETSVVTIGFDIPEGYTGPTITQQPSDSYVADVGGMTDVTIAAEGEGELTYQWYYKDADSEKWIKSILQGDNYDVYMKIARDGRQVYCVVTDAYGFETPSETATIGYAYPEGYGKPSITAQSGDVTVGPGEMAVATVEASGDGELSYQWYYRNAGVEKWSKSIYTGDTYTLSMRAVRDGRQVYCVVTDRYGAKAESDPVTLHMNVTEGYEGPAVLTQPADGSAPKGQTAVVTVSAEGEGELTYQWYYRSAGAEKWNKSIYTGDRYTLTMTETRDGRQVYCVVTDRYGYTVTSEIATLTMGRAG